MSEGVKQNTLIDLDCLVDTRLGLLFQRYRNHYNKLSDVQMNDIIHRTHDTMWQWACVSEDDWCTQYDKRDVGTLKHSLPTDMMVNLKPIIMSKYVEGKTSPVHYPLHLFINIYPYVLDNEECEVLVDAIKECTFDDLDVDVVRLSPESLTPGSVKDSYQVLFMYEGVKWLELHKQELLDCKMPRTILNLPGYLIDNKEAMEAAEQENVDPFERAKVAMSEFITLEFLSPNFFSLYVGDK